MIALPFQVSFAALNSSLVMLGEPIVFWVEEDLIGRTMVPLPKKLVIASSLPWYRHSNYGSASLTADVG